MTQKEKIINYMKEYGFLTSYEAYTELGITQFATRISELEDRGYKFKKEWTSRKNQNGETKDFKRYYLENV